MLSFILTGIVAKKQGAKVLLRIDDMDRDRVRPQYVEDIFESLRFLGLEWNEGPTDAEDFEQHFSQLHRREHYEALLQQLIATGQVFACTCSRADILKQSPDGSYPGTCRHKGRPLDGPNSALRLHTPDAVELEVQTLSGPLRINQFPAAIKDFVVRKKDGAPAYQVCSVADDLYFGVNLICRGADLWPSTLAQLYLAELAGAHSFSKTIFYHHQLLLDAEGAKMSKSAGATSVFQLRKQGVQPEGIFKQIADMVGIKTNITDKQSLIAAIEASGLLSKLEAAPF